MKTNLNALFRDQVVHLACVRPVKWLQQRTPLGLDVAAEQVPREALERLLQLPLGELHRAHACSTLWLPIKNELCLSRRWGLVALNST